jgi:hypothetical protein
LVAKEDGYGHAHSVGVPEDDNVHALDVDVGAAEQLQAAEGGAGHEEGGAPAHQQPTQVQWVEPVHIFCRVQRLKSTAPTALHSFHNGQDNKWLILV